MEKVDVSGSPRGKSTQIQDVWDNTSQKKCTPRQESEARVSETDKLEKDALSIMGLPTQIEKDMMEVSSPLKPRKSPIAIEVSIKENMSLADVIKIKGKG